MPNENGSNTEGDPDQLETFRRRAILLTLGVLAVFGVLTLFIPLNEVMAIAILFGMIAATIVVLRWIAKRIEWNWTTMTVVHVIGLIAAIAIRGCVTQ